MKIRVKFSAVANRALAYYAKGDPHGVDQVLDSINLLRRNPHQGTKLGEYRRLHVGAYRVMFQIIDDDPVVVAIEHVGRSRG